MEEHVILTLAKYDEIKKEITDLEKHLNNVNSVVKRLNEEYEKLQEELNICIKEEAKRCHISQGKVASWVLDDLEEFYGLPLARKIVDYANLVAIQENEQKGETE